MRVIGGIFKGKKILLPSDKTTRPLRDIVKESIFNLIDHSNKIHVDIKNSLILDLFSGSGSFGIECLSRNAKKVFFFENYSNVLKVLKNNLNSLKNKNNYKIFEDDCFDFFNSKKEINSKFDIIFIDPPFKELRVNEIIDTIKDQNLLNKNGLIIIHRHKKDDLKLSKKILVFEERIYGISKISFAY
tara:strand:- start:37 stop:597 length:561 start_codon:yes stop_codon:yes gene_type:complete